MKCANGSLSRHLGVVALAAKFPAQDTRQRHDGMKTDVRGYSNMHLAPFRLRDGTSK